MLCIMMAYTGMRWSEAMGLPPECVHKATLDIDWKLYELNSRFYRGRPKDGSIRTADLPPFLAELLTWHLDVNPRRKCTCRNTEPPWCPGGEYVFLGQRNAHHRRSNYGTRIVRPAADGWYPQRQGRYGRPAAPVLVDSSAPWPGVPLSPWPPAIPGEPYTPPVGRGIPRLAGKDGSGRCPALQPNYSTSAGWHADQAQDRSGMLHRFGRAAQASPSPSPAGYRCASA